MAVKLLLELSNFKPSGFEVKHSLTLMWPPGILLLINVQKVTSHLATVK